jgi:nitroreductase
MWKYPHPTGYRVVVLEAGHIAQNLLLAATAHGLAATPTCALGDRAVEELLGLDRLAEAAVHAVALGVRAAQPSVADTGPVVANPRLARE